MQRSVRRVNGFMMSINAYIEALQWHVDVGAADVLAGEAVDATAMPEIPRHGAGNESAKMAGASLGASSGALTQDHNAAFSPPMVTGTADAVKEALSLAAAAQSLEALREAIAGFDGLPLKKTATHLVFGAGNPEARVMVIGDTPGADDDRTGMAFSGASGLLLDKILSCIGLSRSAENPAESVYITNVLNWRPPGNRTPLPAEIEVSLAFIEKHIALVNPDILILCGGISTKALLGTAEGISKLRGRLRDYQTQSHNLLETPLSVPCIATYHPASLLSTPAQKRLVWQDMLRLQQFLSQK